MWILVVIAIGVGSQNTSGTAVTQIPGYATVADCDNAAKGLPGKADATSHGLYLTGYCIPGPGAK